MISQARVPGLEAVRKYSKLMVLGKPGSGKTSFLQYIAIHCNQGELENKRVPIFISLKTFDKKCQKGKNFSLLSYISQKFHNCGVVEPSQIESILKYGRTMICLDGLDEISEENSDEIVQEIQDFCETYFYNKFIITCRIAAQKYKFKDFTDIEIADFDSKQIENFTQKWFIAVDKNTKEGGKEKANQLLAKLNSSNHKQIREIAITPILLNLICLFFKEKTRFPSNKAKLYEEGLEILLKKWDDERSIKRYSVYANLSLPNRLKLLSQVASITFEQGEYFFEQDKIQQLISNFLHTLPDTNIESSQLLLESEAILKAIEVQHGLLVERSRKIYSFSHLTFQEYFTAKEAEDNQQFLKNMLSHLTEKRWREVFLIGSGMMRNADQLFILMKQRVEAIIMPEQKLQQLFHWINEKSLCVKTTYKIGAIRAFYLELSLAFFKLRSTDFSGNLTKIFNLDILLNMEPKVKTIFQYIFNRHSNLLKKFYFSSIIDFKTTNIRDKMLALDIIISLDDAFNATIESDISNYVSPLECQLNDLGGNEYHIISWLNTEGFNWIKKIESVILDCRNMRLDWYFSINEMEVLNKYYNANNLLVECLACSSKISPIIKKEIEESLFLPNKINYR